MTKQELYSLICSSDSVKVLITQKYIFDDLVSGVKEHLKVRFKATDEDFVEEPNIFRIKHLYYDWFIKLATIEDHGFVGYCAKHVIVIDTPDITHPVRTCCIANYKLITLES